MEAPLITTEHRRIIFNYLVSLDPWALLAVSNIVRSLKSAIIGINLVNGELSVQDAVHLSRLEVVFQTKFWGNIEWAHDEERYDLQARVAAATLFFAFATERQRIMHFST